MKPKALPVRLEGIPSELKEMNTWVMWSYRERDGKWTKMPRTTDGKNASSTNPNTWASYDEVAETLMKAQEIVAYSLSHYIQTSNSNLQASRITIIAKDDLIINSSLITSNQLTMDSGGDTAI